MTIDEDDVSFFTPRVNHHGVNLANEGAKATIVKQFERVMKKMSFGNVLTCILFYRHPKADKDVTDGDGNIVNSDEHEAKFQMYKECQKQSERKEKQFNGISQTCTLYPSSMIRREYESLKVPVAKPLTALLRKPKKSAVLSFLDGLHRCFGFLLNQKEIQEGSYSAEKKAEMLQLLLEYEVNIEYWTLKHDWELDERDVQNFEYIFQKWSAVIGKEAQRSNDRSIMDIFVTEFFEKGNEWLLSEKLLKNDEKHNVLLLRKMNEGKGTKGKGSSEVCLMSYDILQTGNHYHVKILNDLLLVNYIETLITSKFQKKTSVRGGFYTDSKNFDKYFGAFVKGYLDYREAIMVNDLVSWLTDGGSNQYSSPTKTGKAKQYACSRPIQEGKPLQFDLNWQTISLVRCLEPIYYTMRTRNKCEKFFHKMKGCPDAFTHVRLMTLQVCADTMTEEFLSLFIYQNKAVNGGAPQKRDELGREKNGQTNNKLEVTRMIRNNILAIMYEVYCEMGNYTELEHKKLHNIVRKDLPDKYFDALQSLHEGVKVPATSTGMQSLDKQLEKSDDGELFQVSFDVSCKSNIFISIYTIYIAYSMKSVEYIDYFAVWYGRFLLQLNYSQMMRVHMNPNLDTMINKARPPKKEFDPKAFLNYRRMFDFMKVNSVLAIVQQVYKNSIPASDAEKLLVYRYGPVMEKVGNVGVAQVIKNCETSSKVKLNFKFSVRNVVSLLFVPSYNDEKLYAKGAFNPCALGNFFTFPDKSSKQVAEQVCSKYTGIDKSNTLIYEAPDENVHPIFFGMRKSEKSTPDIEKYYDVTTNRIIAEYKRSDGWKRERLFRDVVDEVFLTGMKQSELKDKQSGTFSINRVTKGIEVLERVLTKTSQVHKNSEFLKDSREAAVAVYKEEYGDSESDLEPFEKLELEDLKSNKMSKKVNRKQKKKRKPTADEFGSESSNNSDDDYDDDDKKQGSNSSNRKSKKSRSSDDESKKDSGDKARPQFNLSEQFEEEKQIDYDMEEDEVGN